MKTYLYNGKRAQVEDWAEKDFLSQFPGAKPARKYEFEGKTATVAEDAIGDFLTKYPTAIEVGKYDPAKDPMAQRLSGSLIGPGKTPGQILSDKVSRMEADRQAVERGNKGIPTLSQGSGALDVATSDKLAAVEAEINLSNANRTLADPMATFLPGAVETAQQEKIAAQPVVDKYNEQSRVDYWNERPGKLKGEYDNNDYELVSLDARRGAWTQNDADRYATLLKRQGEIETELPAATIGMTRRQFDAFNVGKDLVKENPFMSYIDALSMGTTSFLLSPYTALTPGSEISDFLSYEQQGVSSEGSTLGNMLRSSLFSLPMSVSMMINPTVGTALTMTTITGQNIKSYYDDKALDATAVLTSLLSGAAQTAIEFATTSAELGTYRSIFQNGGEQALQDAVKADIKQMFKPSLGRVMTSLGKSAHLEGMEEVYQNITDKVIRNIVNGDPMPEMKSYVNELMLDYAGGAFGGAILGAGGTTVNLITHRNTMQKIDELAKTTPSVSLLKQAIEAAQSGDMEKADRFLNESVRRNSIDKVEERAVMQGYALVNDAINMYRAQTVQQTKFENEQITAELADLKRQERELIRSGAEPGFETEDGAKLYEIQERIAQKERIIKENIRLVETDKNLRAMNQAFNEAANLAKSGKDAQAAESRDNAQGYLEQSLNPMGEAFDPATDQGTVLPAVRNASGITTKATKAVEKAAQEQAEPPALPAIESPAPVPAEKPRVTEPAISEAKPQIKSVSEAKASTYVESPEERATREGKIHLSQSKGMMTGDANKIIERTDPIRHDDMDNTTAGKEINVKAKNMPIKVRYVLVPRTEVTVSHNNDFEENPGYPGELQNRDRNRDVLKEQVLTIEAKLDPNEVMDNYRAADGSPIAFRDKSGKWIVLGGNGRMMGINRRAELRGEAAMQEYEQALKDRLQDFGFDPNTDTKGKVLLRAYYGDEDILDLAKLLNTRSGESLSDIEQASSDAVDIANAARKGYNIISLIDLNSRDIMSAANEDFVSAFYDLLVKKDPGQFKTRDGKYTGRMRNRIEMALIMYLFNNSKSSQRILESYYEEDESNVKNVLSGIIDNINMIVKLRNLIEKHNLADLDISQTLIEVINEIDKMRRDGIKIDEILNATDIFSDNQELVPDNLQGLYRAIAGLDSKAKAVKFINGYYAFISQVLDPEQSSLFSGSVSDLNEAVNLYISDWEESSERSRKEKENRQAARNSKGSNRQSDVPGTSGEGEAAGSGSNRGTQEGSRNKVNYPATQRLFNADDKPVTNIPDKVAEDAILGMIPSFYKHTVTYSGRTMTVKFEDGREIVLNRQTGLIKVTAKINAVGQTNQSVTAEGNLRVIIDMVDGFNAQNKTAYHEGFHMAWLMFMSRDQIEILTKHYAKDPKNKTIVDIEEAAADDFENLIAKRKTAVSRVEIALQKLADRIRHFMVKMGFASSKMKVYDIFAQTASGELRGKGVKSEEIKYKLIEEKNLVTIHNIASDSVEKVIERGGLVMPSIAIIDATKSRFSGFGDVSLIAGEDLVNVSAKNPLYTSDAWTPRYPKVYEIVKVDNNLKELSEYLSKLTKRNVSTWEIESNIMQAGSLQYVTSIIYGKSDKSDYRKSQKQAVQTLAKYPINIEEKLLAGWTSNGHKKLIPHTAENAMAIMKKEARQDQGSVWGTSQLRGVLAKRFSSLAQAKKNRNMIVSKEEMAKIEEDTTNMFLGVAQKALAVRKYDGSRYDDIATDIYDMSRRGWGFISDWYEDDSIRSDFSAIIDHMRNLPTQYFEYKPQRVVQINEFLAAVVPNSAKSSTVKALKDSGLKVVRYDDNDAESRYEAVKSISEKLGTRYKLLSGPDTTELDQIDDVRAKYEGTDKWMKAPNGKPSNLNERQWLQVRTPAFKAWFGDWENDPANASKVVDENGEPMVVYHGSIDSFSAFNYTKDDNTAGHKAIFFSSNVTEAENYAVSAEAQKYFDDDRAPTIYPVFLNIRNPQVRDAMGRGGNGGGSASIRGAVKDAKFNEKDGVIINNVIDAPNYQLDYDRSDAEGIAVKDYYGGEIQDLYIVFENTQIKSATANVGTFDPHNPDIRYKLLDADIQKRLEEAKRMLETMNEEQITEQISQETGIMPEQVKEKVLRQIRAGYREGGEQIGKLLAASSVAGVDRYIDTNKPEGTDKSDLTFHLEDAEMYAQQMGLTAEEAANLGADRYTYYLQGLNMFARGNALVQELQGVLNQIDKNRDSGIEDAALIEKRDLLVGMVISARTQYENMKGAAGRLLRHAREEKLRSTIGITQIAQSMREDQNRIYAEIEQLQQELAIAEQELAELEKVFAELSSVVDSTILKRFKIEFESPQQKLDATRQRMDELRRNIAVLKESIVAKTEQIKANQEQVEKITQVIPKTGKANITIIPPMPPTWYDISKAIMYSSMLSSPMTHFRNIAGNITNLFSETLVNVLNDPKGGLLSAIAMLNNATNFKEVKRALKDNLDSLRKYDLMSSTNGEVKSLRGKLYSFFSIITRLLAAEDAYFYTLAYSGQMAHIAAQESRRTGASYKSLVSSPTTQMIVQARYEAKRATFNQNPEGVIGYLVSAIEGMVGNIENMGVPGKLTAMAFKISVMPFTRVVANVANLAIDWSPLGFIRAGRYISKATGKGSIDEQRKIWFAKSNGEMGEIDTYALLNPADVADGKGDKLIPTLSPFQRRDLARQLTRAGVGTILMILAQVLLKEIISGNGPADPEKRRQLMDTGWRPNSMHIGERWIPYNDYWMSSVLAVIGNYNDYYRYNKGSKSINFEDKLFYSLMVASSTFLDKSFLRGVGTLMDAISSQDEKYLKRTIGNVPGTMIVPNAVRQINDIFYTDIHKPETTAQYAMYNLRPITLKWLKDEVPVAINVYGQTAQKTSIKEQLVGSPIRDNQPFYVYDRKNVPHDIREVLQALNNSGLKVPSTNSYQIKLDDDDNYITLRGFDKMQLLKYRGIEVSMFLIDHKDQIIRLSEKGEVDDLDGLLKGMATKATKRAKKLMVQDYVAKKLHHEYEIEHKSKE